MLSKNDSIFGFNWTVSCQHFMCPEAFLSKFEEFLNIDILVSKILSGNQTNIYKYSYKSFILICFLLAFYVSWNRQESKTTFSDSSLSSEVIKQDDSKACLSKIAHFLLVSIS